MKLKIVIIKIFIAIIFLTHQNVIAGPPFLTDDPEPTELNHWEFYLSSVSTFFNNNAVGTLPHIDLNYGAFKNAHLHLMVPLNFSYDNIQKFKYSYTITEIGIKYRFLEESENYPQLGIFPALEIPKSFKLNEIQVFLPLWMQKSFHKVTTYGGVGYWIIPGKENLNWIFAGWQIQYNINDIISQGVEVIYHTKQSNEDIQQLSINFGGNVNFNRNFHFLYSIGHSLTGNNCFLAYFGILITV